MSNIVWTEIYPGNYHGTLGGTIMVGTIRKSFAGWFKNRHPVWTARTTFKYINGAHFGDTYDSFDEAKQMVDRCVKRLVAGWNAVPNDEEKK